MLECKRELASEFEMKYLGLMHYFLILEVWQRPGDIFLSQGISRESIGNIWNGRM